MVPIEKVRDIITKYENLEKELSSGKIDPKLFAKKSKEYSSLGEIIITAKKFVNFENERNDLINITSNRLFNELKTFVWNNGKPEAMRGYNDDLVMSMAIACWVRDTALVSNQRDAEYKRALLNAMSTSKTQLNTAVPGMVNYGEPKKVNEMKEIMTNFPGLFKG